jgi:hypothetical protein
MKAVPSKSPSDDGNLRIICTFPMLFEHDILEIITPIRTFRQFAQNGMINEIQTVYLQIILPENYERLLLDFKKTPITEKSSPKVSDR